jgi:hypothetical protein
VSTRAIYDNEANNYQSRSCGEGRRQRFAKHKMACRDAEQRR